MVGTRNARGLTLGADSVVTSQGSSAHPPAWAPSPPVQLLLAAQLEMLILGIGRVAFPVLQLQTQRVGCSAGELVHQLIAQPVLPSRVTEALGGEGGEGGLYAKELGWARVWGHLSKTTLPDDEVYKVQCGQTQGGGSSPTSGAKSLRLLQL